MWCRMGRTGAGRLGGWGIVGAVVAVGLVACCAKEPQTQPPPASITDPTSEDQHARVVYEYASSLVFLTDSMIRGSSDKQPLDIVVGGVTQLSGCVGQIMPESDAHNNRFDLLRGDIRTAGGVITAAFQIDAKEARCGGYQAGNLDLPVGLSYVWVGGFNDDTTLVENGQEYAIAEALVIPFDTLLTVRGPVPIKVCKHPEYSFNHSQANWTFDPNDADAWWTCAKLGCCNGS